MKTKHTNLPLPSPQPPFTMLNLTLFTALITTILLPSPAAALFTGDFVSRRCKEAAATDPNFTYDFCIACLEYSNPNIHNVATMEELVGVAMNLTARNATRIMKRISRMLTRPTMDPYCRRALEDCRELYADAKGELNDAAKDVFENKDCFKANVEVSAAMDSSSTCEDGLRERRRRSGEVAAVAVAAPLAVENEVFFRLTAMLLSFINMLHYR